MIDYLEDTAAYLNLEKRDRILFELYSNSLRTIKGVYIFKHFDDYVIQRLSDRNEDKKDVYWNASYYEKLMDYIKISVAFETYNKAILLQQGYIIHRIKRNQENSKLFKDQQARIPVRITDFLKVSEQRNDLNKQEIYLTGFQENFATINYSHTLSKSYQDIIGLNPELCYRLNEINQKRNRLHFFTDFKGAFEVKSHLAKWKWIKETAIDTIQSTYIQLYNPKIRE